MVWGSRLRRTLCLLWIASSLALHVSKASWCFRTALSHVWSQVILLFAQGPAGWARPWRTLRLEEGAQAPSAWNPQLWFISRRLRFYPTRMSSHRLKRCSSPGCQEGTYSDTYAWSHLGLNKKKKSMQFVLRRADPSCCHGYTLRYRFIPRESRLGRGWAKAATYV